MKSKDIWIALTSLALLICWPIAAQAQLELDKPKNTKPLPSPYTITATRPRILDTAREILTHCKIPYQNESKSILPAGDKLVTENIIFTTGVNARTDLAHYSNPPVNELRAWTAGRVWLEIIALPLDVKRSQIQIVAHVQGRSGGITNSGEEEWIDCPSNGRLEDEVLRGLAGKILGIDLSIDRNGRRRILNCEY